MVATATTPKPSNVTAPVPVTVAFLHVECSDGLFLAVHHPQPRGPPRGAPQLGAAVPITNILSLIAMVDARLAELCARGISARRAGGG